MLAYARSDTHFLLFIYDNLRNAIMDRGRSRSPSSTGEGPQDTKPDTPNPLMSTVLARSQETALGTYKREAYDAEEGSGPNGWDTLARKWNKPTMFFSANLQGPAAMEREVFKAVHQWRDRVARQEDESTR
jgi:exosome complex exonuclease RRP6